MTVRVGEVVGTDRERETVPRRQNRSSPKRRKTDMAVCATCGKRARFMSSHCGECLAVDRRRIVDLATNTAAVQAAEAARAREWEDRVRQVVVTTTPSVDGFRIAETLEVITAERVFRKRAGSPKGAPAQMSNQSPDEALRTDLRLARRACLDDLRREAAELGADAVIGVTLGHTAFGTGPWAQVKALGRLVFSAMLEADVSGGGEGLVVLIASGTAVKLSPRASSGP